MLPLLSLAIRSLIQITVTLGLIKIADHVVLPMINRALQEIMEKLGVSEDTAKDITANELLTFAEEVGIGALVLRTKIPTKIAERLGFTSKGWGKRTVTKNIPVITKPAISISTKIIGAMVAWNLLTDWVWIGNMLNFLPGDAQDDIQKRALSILNLMDAARNVTYSAEKAKRSLTQQERALIKQVADEAERQINQLRDSYEKRLVLFGRRDVAQQLESSTKALKLDLQTLRQIAQLIPAQEVRKEITEATVLRVIDGDTVKLDNGETVRLVGIDAPESTTEDGETSKKYLKDRIEGRRVRVESDPDALIDIYGRRLGVIWLLP